MKRLEKMMQDKRNMGLDFVVHIQNKKELDDLIDVLTKMDFTIQFSMEPQTLKEWMEERAEEESYDICFRIRNRKDDRCVTYNPSVEHWRMYCNNILEIRSGELEFHEGDYSFDAAKIEAKKIWNQINEEVYGDDYSHAFGFSGKMSEEEIVRWLMNRFDGESRRSEPV